MEVNGKIVTIALSTDIKKNGGGSYKGWKLVYEDSSSGEIKTIAKHENTLKYAAALKNGLESLAAGDNFTMEMEKKDGFWNPTSVYKSGAAPKKDTNAPQQAQQRSISNNSSYATAEERAQTQQYIVRQSSITAALKLLELHGNKKATTREVISLAQEFEAYVFNQAPKELTDLGSFEDMDDDIPV